MRSHRHRRRHQQAVLAVADDLRHAADGGRDHRRADRQRLEHGVRQVLPGRREQRRVGGGEERSTSSRDPAPRNRTRPSSPRSAAPRSSASRSGPSPRTRSATSGTAQGVERDVERLLGGEPAGEAEHEPSTPSSARSSSRGGSAGSIGRRVRHHDHARRIEPPAERDLAQVGARRDDARGAPQARGAGRAQRAQAPPAAQRAGTPPASRRSDPRCARSNASSATSFTTSGRRTTAAPAEARRTMLVA